MDKPKLRCLHVLPFRWYPSPTHALLHNCFPSLSASFNLSKKTWRFSQFAFDNTHGSPSGLPFLLVGKCEVPVFSLQGFLAPSCGGQRATTVPFFSYMFIEPCCSAGGHQPIGAKCRQQRWHPHRKADIFNGGYFHFSLDRAMVKHAAAIAGCMQLRCGSIL